MDVRVRFTDEEQANIYKKTNKSPTEWVHEVLSSAYAQLDEKQEQKAEEKKEEKQEVVKDANNTNQS